MLAGTAVLNNSVRLSRCGIYWARTPYMVIRGIIHITITCRTDLNSPTSTTAVWRALGFIIEISYQEILLIAAHILIRDWRCYI